MFILDTNVISEILRPSPEAKVLAWFTAKPRTLLFTTTMTRAELLYGAHILPDGRRKQALLAAVLHIFDADLYGQVLGFDPHAADLYAQIAANRKQMGHPISQFDAMIAAVARTIGACLVTRNSKDFEHCGIETINPWKN